jgi:hypothetical protein
MNLHEVGWGGHERDLSGSGKGQLVGTCKHGNEPSRSIKCGECFAKGLFSMEKVIIIIIIDGRTKKILTMYKIHNPNAHTHKGYMLK